MINGIVNLTSDNIINGEPVKALRMEFLIYLFPNFELDLRNNEGDDENDLADESYQSRYLPILSPCTISLHPENTWVWVCWFVCLFVCFQIKLKYFL